MMEWVTSIVLHVLNIQKLNLVTNAMLISVEIMRSSLLMVDAQNAQ